MAAPLAYLLTWTCKGTWLHGDPRGSADDVHNKFGTPRLDIDATREARETTMLGSDMVILHDRMRTVVDRAIQDHCRIRGWQLLALNVRTNHVHVVVMGTHEPEEMMGQFKSWGTRRLRREKLILPNQSVWTSQGSNRYLWDRKSLQDAITYVENQ